MFAGNLKTFEFSLSIPLRLYSHKGIHPQYMDTYQPSAFLTYEICAYIC